MFLCFSFVVYIRYPFQKSDKNTLLKQTPDIVEGYKKCLIIKKGKVKYKKKFYIKQRLPDNDNGNTSKRQDDTDRKLVKYHNKFVLCFYINLSSMNFASGEKVTTSTHKIHK